MSKNTGAAVALGEQLTAAWKEAGQPSYRTLEREMLMDLGAAPSNTTIANYHKGGVDPSNADDLAIWWLARRYGKELAELSPLTAERLDRAAALSGAAAFPCFWTAGDPRQLVLDVPDAA